MHELHVTQCTVDFLNLQTIVQSDRNCHGVDGGRGAILWAYPISLWLQMSGSPLESGQGVSSNHGGEIEVKCGWPTPRLAGDPQEGQAGNRHKKGGPAHHCIQLTWVLGKLLGCSCLTESSWSRAGVTLDLFPAPESGGDASEWVPLPVSRGIN